MAKATKPNTRKDYTQCISTSFNDTDNTLSVSTFVTGKVGYKIERTNTEAGDLDGSAAGDDFSYYDGATLLYTLRILYSDAAKLSLTSVERVA